MVHERLELGIIEETQQLLKTQIDKNWLKKIGLSYRLVIRFLDGELSRTELSQSMATEFRRLMKRQRTWFNRMSYAQFGDATLIKTKIESLLSEPV